MPTLEPLRAHARLRAQLRAELPHLIRAARADGQTWEVIAAAADMSRAGVIKASQIKR